MERKSFNEVLKQRELRDKAERAQRAAEKDNGHIALDDSERVKVLSPGRLVFKRFIRNKLAIVGTAILIFMFLFSFVGALLYPYGQTQKFHKFDYLFTPYANAQRRTDLTNYVLNEAAVDSKVQRLINSKVKELQASEADEGIIVGESSLYYLRKVNESVYELKAAEAEAITTFTSAIYIGKISTLAGMEYAPDTEAMGSDFEAAAAAAIADESFAFSYDGSDYEIRNYTKRSGGEIYTGGEGLFTYVGESLGASFERQCAEAIESGKLEFSFEGSLYAVEKQELAYSISKCIPGESVIISTNYGLNVSTSGDPLATDKDFLVQALLAFSSREPFTYNGTTYTIDDSTELPEVLVDGERVAEFSTFVVKDPAGKDAFNLEFKEAIERVADELEEKILLGGGAIADEGEETDISSQVDESRAMRAIMDIPGERVADGNRIITAVDENGEVIFEPTEVTIVKQVNDYADSYNYVISCARMSYLIDIYSAPSGEHVFGTDGDGYDVLSRMMHGGQISLLVGFVVVILEILLGTIMGGIAGYFGGWIDNIIMRLVDIFYCIPSMPILIIMGAFMDDAQVDPYVRLMYLMAILGFLGWAGVARLVRGQILSLREQEFMVAAEATGVKVKRRIFRHLVPNVMPQLIVTATASLGGVIITESTLSFLGLGVKHPLATWGTMINSVTQKNEDILHYVYIWVPVGLLICLTVIAFNFVGDGLRDAFDPKMKK